MDDLVVLFLISVKVLEICFRLWRRGKFGHCAEDLTSGNSADVDVVAQDGAISRRDRERYFGEGRVQGLDANDGISLIVQPQDAEETLNLNVGIQRPQANVITMLISNSRAFGVEFNVNAITFCVSSKELARNRDRSGIRVLCVVDALGLSQGTGRVFTFA